MRTMVLNATVRMHGIFLNSHTCPVKISEKGPFFYYRQTLELGN